MIWSDNVKKGFLTVLLIIAISLGMIGSYLLIRESRVKDNAYLDMVLEQEGEQLNTRLRKISDSVDMLAQEILFNLDDYTALSDPEYEKTFSRDMYEFLEAALYDNEDAVFMYLRYNPDIVGTNAGWFLQKSESGIEPLPLTDLLEYESSDVEHVGWYYIPVNYGTATWLEPYQNNNVGVYMISYVVPIIKDDTVIGVVGIDVALSDLLQMVDQIRVYDTGYASLLDKSSNVLNPSENSLDENVVVRSKKLVNDMTLVLTAPEKEVYHLRYGIVYQIVMVAYFLLLIILLVERLLQIFRKKEDIVIQEAGSSAMNMTMIYLGVVFVILAVQIIYAGVQYRDIQIQRKSRIQANNTYEETLTVTGDFDFFPYSFLDEDGNPQGHDIEIINEIANRLGVNVNITLQDWAVAKESAEQNEYDVILGLESISNEKQSELLKTNVVADDSLVVYGKQSVNGIQDLAEASLATINGTVRLDAYGLEDNAHLYDSYTEVLEAVEAGEHDYAIVEKTVAEAFVKEKEYRDLFQVYEIMDSRLCFGVSQGNEELREQIDAVLGEMQEDGTLAKIERRWFELENSDHTVWSVVKANKEFFVFTGILLVISICGYIFSGILYKKNKELRKAQGQNEELKFVSEFDPLTGLSNRRRYEAVLKEISHRPELSDVTVAAMDINGLKEVNDTQGHLAGDELIRGAADCIADTFGEYGECFRIGGDEFMAILSGMVPEKALLKEMLDEKLARRQGDMVKEIAVSCGIVQASEFEHPTISDLVNVADQKMYEDKVAYYRRKGVDKKGQQAAFESLCASYTKILYINLTEDTYVMIQVEEDEKTKEKGYSDKASSWLYDFAMSGQVHEEDREQFIEKTDLTYLRDYFAAGNEEYCIRYRRKIGEEYKKVMLEMVPAKEYTETNQAVYLYVKNIDNLY